MMRILWFSNTPSNAAEEFGSTYAGGGWIAALETLLVKEKIHTLGICFFYEGDMYKKLERNGVSYYGIPLKKRNGLERIISRHTATLADDGSVLFDTVIQDFKPDIIHVFGTEMGYGKILVNKFEKVIFHLQGLVAPISKVYFPLGISVKDIFRYSPIKNSIRGLTFYHLYMDMMARGKREVEILAQWKYFSGRTHWDKNVTKLVNPTAQYFHCDELLREDFFKAEWLPPSNIEAKKTIVIGTTINPNIYKGLDLIYKVLPLLKAHTICWKIFGLSEDNQLNVVVKNRFNNKRPNASIQFCGPLSAKDLIEALKTCHFFVHPSYIDNSPNSVCEAQLMGMPVLSSSVGGVSTLIRNREDGFLFNPYDQYDLAGLLHSLITDYPTALEAGKKARVAALKRHSPQAILQSVNEMYTTIYNN
jgi:glycosyltransferase involved in cell wall biosynthesis